MFNCLRKEMSLPKSVEQPLPYKGFVQTSASRSCRKIFITTPLSPIKDLRRFSRPAIE